MSGAHTLGAHKPGTRSEYNTSHNCQKPKQGTEHYAHDSGPTLPGATHKTPGNRHTHQTTPGRHPRPVPISGNTTLTPQGCSTCQMHTPGTHGRTKILGTQSQAHDAGHTLSAHKARSTLQEYNSGHATPGTQHRTHNTEHTVPGMHTHQEQNAEHTCEVHTLDIQHCIRCTTLSTQLRAHRTMHTLLGIWSWANTSWHTVLCTQSQAHNAWCQMPGTQY